MAQAETCLAPPRPYVPAEVSASREYADLIRQDFQTYFDEIEDYFRCMDEERGRAFTEAREVSQDYGRFIQAMEQ